MGVVTGTVLLAALALRGRGGQGGPPGETDRGLQGELRHLQRPRGTEDAGARRGPH